MSMLKKRILPLLFCLLMVTTAAGCDGGQALDTYEEGEETYAVIRDSELTKIT